MAPGRKLRRRVPHRGARGAIVRKRRGQPLHRPRHTASSTARGAARARRARVSGRPYAEVIGDPIAHSKSPLIHSFWLEKLGIDADYRATLVTADQLGGYFAARGRDPDWRGCNITMPNKIAALQFVHRHRDPSFPVETINIAVPGKGRLEGLNSDTLGVYEPLTKQVGSRTGAKGPAIV